MVCKWRSEGIGKYSGKLFLLFWDMVCIVISMIGALWLRFDFHLSQITPEFFRAVCCYLPINLICTLLLFKWFRLYNYLWQFAGVREVWSIVAASCASTVFQFIGMQLLQWYIPRSYPFIYVILLVISVTGCRFFYRCILTQNKHSLEEQPEDFGVRTMIVGAGEAGSMLINEIQSSKHLARKLCCVIDDDPLKAGTFLRGVPVVGGTDTIAENVKAYHIEEIIIAIPSMKPLEKKQLMKKCSETACKVLHLPGLYQLINREVSVSMLREVDINDLLGRPSIDLDMGKLVEYVEGKVILVTGGGGSIGSEICRQLAQYRPKCLIVFDIYENSAYAIRNELLAEHPELNLVVLIGSVRNQKRVDTIFEKYHPDLIFHAAAHKHVPLMEDSPNEAIKNNVLGTWVIANAAHQYHAQKMVLISTDKAVRPTNIMGASKRVCELIVQSFAQNSQTEFASVRFGNVLGSNGSVVPLFRNQIAAGGPVTVTHPDIIRYFMTIPEAVSLVLQCGALAAGGEIFILDMGEPVKILDLAKDMIRLSGLEPEKDIAIEFVGLRPGEKLYEELLISLDNLKKTENERIFVAQQTKVETEAIQAAVKRLIDAAFSEAEDIREQMMVLIPEYSPGSNELGSSRTEVPGFCGQRGTPDD